MLFLYIVLGFTAIIGLGMAMRSHFRDNLRPFQVVGARVKGEIVNVTIISVNKELRTISILDGKKEPIEISFDNVYLPTFKD